ncbi:MAG: twin-arginine translocase TatA/TatE family subunit [Bryobacteraceae bacterium]
MGTLGWQETVFIFLLALLLFGPKKLPELGRTLGKAMTEFRRASSELKATFDKEMKSLEQETESLKQVAKDYQYDTYNYDYSSYESTYEGAYGTESNDSTATTPSTASASALQGAESPAALPEGTVAHGSETALVHQANGNSPEGAPGAPEHSATSGHDESAPTTAEHNA